MLKKLTFSLVYILYWVRILFEPCKQSKFPELPTECKVECPFASDYDKHTKSRGILEDKKFSLSVNVFTHLHKCVFESVSMI